MALVSAETKLFRQLLRKGGFTEKRAKRYSVLPTGHGGYEAHFINMDRMLGKAAVAVTTRTLREGGLEELARTVLHQHFNPPVGEQPEQPHYEQKSGLPMVGPAVLNSLEQKYARALKENPNLTWVAFIERLDTALGGTEAKTCNRDGKPCSFPRCMPCDEVRGGLFPVARAHDAASRGTDAYYGDRPKGGPPTAKRSIAKLFVLNRRHDETGTSGTGIVAEGIKFSNGKVALHWLSHLGAVNVYDSMDVCEVLHGHDGNTVVEWKDEVG